jgi:hypothetical protein
LKHPVLRDPDAEGRWLQGNRANFSPSVRKEGQVFRKKPINDGSGVNPAVEVCISNIGNSPIGKMNAKGSYQQLFHDDALLHQPGAYFAYDVWWSIAESNR